MVLTNHIPKSLAWTCVVKSSQGRIPVALKGAYLLAFLRAQVPANLVFRGSKVSGFLKGDLAGISGRMILHIH